MYTYNWNDMTSKERNQLISQYVLQFDCFESDQGLDWYNRYYDMGFWHYSTSLTSALELAEKVSRIDPNVTVEMKYQNGKGYCRIRSHRITDDKGSIYLVGENMQEAICLAVLRHFEFDIKYG
ncbi:hypothetical protein [Paenibacillus sp. FSL R7-0337]|uniref:hypothetical protein n=1 Tax=Paenibacillus sp. FSL R7-0337 TaxID=1926588 RepID=UPI00096EDF3C|nr:hypothetical protein [Paenibacillus sp. FSL R7-0337]OMF84313.1 hypothetical protein BK147_33385 [Paenibacillus sp. FSL R7-0337]